MSTERGALIAARDWFEAARKVLRLIPKSHDAAANMREMRDKMQAAIDGLAVQGEPVYQIRDEYYWFDVAKNQYADYGGTNRTLYTAPQSVSADARDAAIERFEDHVEGVAESLRGYGGPAGTAHSELTDALRRFDAAMREAMRR